MKNTKLYSRLKQLYVLLVFVFTLSLMIPSFAIASTLWDKQVGMDTKSGQVGEAYGETGTRNEVSDVRMVIAKIINVFLGFMGIIFLILVIYGGILWMTAAGNDDNIRKAKSLLIAGVIGLIVVLSSFAIAKLVTDKVLMATTSKTTTTSP